MAIATVGAILACAGSAFAANARPDANFGFFPRDPVAGQSVRFVSYACDPDGELVEQAWDLDGDGLFDDDSGRGAVGRFPAGTHLVRLSVSDRRGITATRNRIIDVERGSPEYVVPEPFKPPLLIPFPLVRLSGNVSGAVTRVRVLSVRAPVCSRATVLCQGPSCPWRRRTQEVGRGPARFRGLSTLAAGAIVRVLVTKRHRIGKYTSFRMRADRPPKRRDRCLPFGARRGVPCPRE
jgi:hypothetical protein